MVQHYPAALMQRCRFEGATLRVRLDSPWMLAWCFIPETDPLWPDHNAYMLRLARPAVQKVHDVAFLCQAEIFCHFLLPEQAQLLIDVWPEYLGLHSGTEGCLPCDDPRSSHDPEVRVPQMLNALVKRSTQRLLLAYVELT